MKNMTNNVSRALCPNAYAPFSLVRFCNRRNQQPKHQHPTMFIRLVHETHPFGASLRLFTKICWEQIRTTGGWLATQVNHMDVVHQNVPYVFVTGTSP